MTVEVIGIDHIYIAVRELRASEAFYDRAMKVLGFRKREADISGEPHVLYHNRQMGYVLRPAQHGTPGHYPYAPGLHHLCFRVADEDAVNRAAQELRTVGIEATEPRYYPAYDHDYYATFLEDPDGIRLEVTNFRESRRKRMLDWNNTE